MPTTKTPVHQIGLFTQQRFASPSLSAMQDVIGRSGDMRVLIVGAGPVGLAVTLGLARYGVRSLLIETDDSVCEGSRVDCNLRRSPEISDRLGVADAAMVKGLPWTDRHSFYCDHGVVQDRALARSSC